MILIFRFLSFLPLPFLHGLGAFCGWLAWLCSPTYRRHMRENMALALGTEGAQRVRTAAIIGAGQSSLELAKIWLRPQEESAARVVKISGWEHVEAAQRAGKGIVYLTPHLGCFEITAQYLSTQAPITVLYRPPKQAWLQNLIETGRARAQLRIAAADLSGVRALLKALKRGEAVGLLPDQAPKVGEGRWMRFFWQTGLHDDFGRAADRKRRGGADGLGRTLAEKRGLPFSYRFADASDHRDNRSAHAANQR